MAAHLGRRMRIYNAVASPRVLLAGVQAKTLKFNNEPVDITSDDDAGFRTILATPGLQSLDLSIAGICKDAVLLTKWATGNGQIPLEIEDLETTELITANFFLQNLQLEGPTAQGVPFSAEFISSGTITYAP